MELPQISLYRRREGRSEGRYNFSPSPESSPLGGEEL